MTSPHWITVAILLCGVLITETTWAACTGSTPTWTSTPDRTSVAACVSGASDGDTITVTTGTESWVSAVTIPNTKGLTITGGSGGTTTISTQGFSIRPGSGKVNRISGFAFSGISYAVDVLAIDSCRGPGWCTNILAIHDNVFNSSGIRILGRVTGVIYANTFANATAYTTIRFHPGSSTDLNPYGLDGGGDEWAADSNLGGADFLFVEGNTVVIGAPAAGSAFVDGRSGNRYVARYNSLQNQMMTHHAAEIAHDRGARAFEYYNNFVHFTQDYSQAAWYPIRGGTGVIYNNRVQTYRFSSTWPNDQPMSITEPRLTVSGMAGRDPWENACDGSAGKFCLGGPPMACTQDADCTGTVNGFAVTGPCVNIDGGEGGTGYPCRDQWGRGKDNATTGVQASEPVLSWNNKYCKTYPTVGGVCDAETGTLFAQYPNTAYIQRGRDYCDMICVGGTDAGKGCAVDGECTGGGTCAVATTKPMVCNGVTLSYTAYTCPHPLTGYTGSCSSTTAGTAGYNIAGSGGTLTLGGSGSLTPGPGGTITLWP